MDEKKVRGAIKALEITIDIGKQKIEYNKTFEPKNDNQHVEKSIECAKTAIEALEKQLPEKVKQSGVTTQDGIFRRINGIDGVPYDLCPNCEVNLCTDGILGRNKKDMKYCERCGQRLDWSEE